jgi:molybdate transport system ATP-binding protein
MKTEPILQVSDLRVQIAGKPVLDQVNFSIYAGENLAIIGASGSGKSLLIRSLAGQYFSRGDIRFSAVNGHKPNIVTISQQHQFKNLSNLNSFYYQQRFNSCDADDAVTVNAALLETGSDNHQISNTLEQFGIGHVRYTRLIQLSNGEHKRFQLAKAVLQNAEWLLLDNPYTGLDIAARKLLNQILDQLTATGMHILLVSSATDMPSSITHIALLQNGKISEPLPYTSFDADKYSLTAASLFKAEYHSDFESVTPAYTFADFSVAIKMVDATVVYNNRTILDKINWEVKKGECWSVSGHNGSGKSTLLSLVNGDNPQAFANEIYLFDRKKGSGETIWDIKQKIGYVSPELHHYFDANANVYEVVASGLFDTIGLFKKLSKTQEQIVQQWMGLLQIDGHATKSFKQLSNGEQRLALLARALVKNPPMLILDEPCQGLDAAIAARFIRLINDICVHMKKTLIYVSHYEEEIPPCVTYSLKLEQGKIAA